MWGGDFSLSELIAQVIFIVAIIALTIGFSIKWAYDTITKKEYIESTHRINPILKLTVNNNKIDTIYIYKKGDND